MAWRGMITSASSPLWELVYFAIKQLIRSKEQILDCCLCGIISCGPPPHNSPRTSRPCRVVRRVPSGVVRPHFGRIWGLNSSQPLPPLAAPKGCCHGGQRARSLAAPRLKPPVHSVNGHFKSIEFYLHDGYYTTCSHSSGKFRRNLFLLGFSICRTVYFGKDCWLVQLPKFRPRDPDPTLGIELCQWKLASSLSL